MLLTYIHNMNEIAVVDKSHITFLSIWQIAIDTKISCHFLWFFFSMLVCVCVYIYFDVSIINIIMHMRMVINLFTHQQEREIYPHNPIWAWTFFFFLILNVGEENSHQDFVSFVSRAANWSSLCRTFWMHSFFFVSIREEVINLPFVKTS